MFGKINKAIGFLKDLFYRSSFKAGQPYIPRPSDQEQDKLPGEDNIFYKETRINAENLGPISFGSATELIVDNNGNTTQIRQRQGHILGRGRLVTSLNPTIENGMVLPGVGGGCYACKKEAALLLEAGQISIEEAYRHALFDTGSAAQCDGCGRRDLCIHHCRPFQKADGTQLSLCPDCTRAAQREKWTAISLSILLSPFIDKKKLPPGTNGGKNDC